MKSINPKFLKIILAAAIAAGLACLVVFLAWPKYHSQTQKAAVTNSFSYTYRQLESYKVTGFVANTGMSFDKPVEFTSVLQAKQAPVADLVHVYGKDKIDIADMAAYAQPAGPGMDEASLAKNAADTSSDKYGSTWLPLQQFAAQRLVNLNLNYQDAKPLIAANLKHAWEREFTTTVKSRVGPDLSKKGVLIIAAGQKADYYFVIDAINSNWQNNQPVWQRVIDSIRIDQ
jgi:hypothetical protein